MRRISVLPGLAVAVVLSCSAATAQDSTIPPKISEVEASIAIHMEQLEQCRTELEAYQASAKQYVDSVGTLSAEPDQAILEAFATNIGSLQVCISSLEEDIMGLYELLERLKRALSTATRLPESR